METLEEKTKTTRDFFDSFVHKIQHLKNENFEEIRRAKNFTKRKIEEFQKEQEELLKEKQAKIKASYDKSYLDSVEVFLNKLLTKLSSFYGKSKYTKADNLELINLLNTYKDSHGYFWGKDKSSVIIRQAEKAFTKLYQLKINEWRKKFGNNQRIEKTVSYFLQIVNLSQHHTLFFTESDKREDNFDAGKLSEEVEKLRFLNEELDEEFNSLEKTISEKQNFIKTQKFEDASSLRDKEKELRQKIWDKLRLFFPKKVSNVFISEVIENQLLV